MALRKEQNGQTKQGKQTQNKNIIVGKTTQPNHPSDHRISQHRSTRLEVIITGIASRAVRNISRRKMRALLVVIALGFSLAILVAVPAGISANQSATQNLTANLSSNMAQSLTMLNTTITQTEASINQTMTEIDCSLTPSAPSGFGFQTGVGVPIGGAQVGGTTSGPVGGSGSGPVVIGTYGGGPFGNGGSTPMNETYYDDINNVSGVAAIEPILQVTEGHNKTVTPTLVQTAFKAWGRA